MSDLYILLANLVALLHLATALFILSVPLAIYRRAIPRWYIVIQVSLLSIAALFHFTSGVCPLTYGEKTLMEMGGKEAYIGSFLNHYSSKFFDFSIPDKLISNIIILMTILLITNMIIRKAAAKNLQWIRAQWPW